MNSMISDLEKETMKKLVKVYRPQEAIDIYGRFITAYKIKHLNDELPQTTNEWYEKRGQTFNRFILRYYLTNERKQK
jgi:hypothetical protein